MSCNTPKGLGLVFYFTNKCPHLLHSLHIAQGQTPNLAHDRSSTQIHSMKSTLFFIPYISAYAIHLVKHAFLFFSPTTWSMGLGNSLSNIPGLVLSLPFLCQLTPLSRLLQHSALACPSHCQMVVQSPAQVCLSCGCLMFLQCWDYVTFFHVPAQCQAIYEQNQSTREVLPSSFCQWENGKEDPDSMQKAERGGRRSGFGEKTWLYHQD